MFSEHNSLTRTFILVPERPCATWSKFCFHANSSSKVANLAFGTIFAKTYSTEVSLLDDSEVLVFC